MPKLETKAVEWEELRVGMRIALQRRGGRNRRIGSEFCGFITGILEDELEILFDHRTTKIWVEGARVYVEKGWIRLDPRRL